MNKALNDSLIWYKKMLAEKTLKCLRRNNIGGCYVETLRTAREKLVELIPKGSKVGYVKAFPPAARNAASTLLNAAKANPGSAAAIGDLAGAEASYLNVNSVAAAE